MQISLTVTQNLTTVDISVIWLRMWLIHEQLSKRNLKIPNRQSEIVNLRRDNTMAKQKRRKRHTMICKALRRNTNGTKKVVN
jgi:hypothetical protein